MPELPNNEKLASQGARLCIQYKGRELAANVEVSPGAEPGAKNEAHIACLQDGVTGKSVTLTKDIRAAFQLEYEKVILKGETE